MKKIKIVICSGGTGGHLFPAKATVDSLLSYNLNSQPELPKVNITFFTDKRTLNYLQDFNTTNVTIKTIITLQFSGKGLFYKLKSLSSMAIGGLQTLYYFIINRPKVVVAFGGYVSVPVLIAATLLRIPIILHEQNAILGRANRLFVKFANRIVTSFAITLGLNKYLNKVHHIGLPLRKEILFASNKTSTVAYSTKLNVNNQYTLAILGGSQGAKIFGDFIPQSFTLLPKELQQKLIVFHQCRAELLNKTNEAWQKTLVKEVIIRPFFTNIAEVLKQSDLIVTRSGAATVAEINCIGKAAVYIPFKQAILNHQKHNAISMVNKNCAVMLTEEDLNFNSFNDIIIDLLTNNNKRNKMAVLAKEECKNNAASLLSSIVIKIAQNKHAKL